MKLKSARHVRGATFIDLIKFLKNLRQKQPLPPLSPGAEALLATRVQGTEWYPLQPFLDLLNVLDQVVLRGDETRAMELGAAGGSIMRGVQKAYVTPGDIQSSVMAMRHAWRAHYDFGALSAVAPTPRAVIFKLEDYADLTMPHALLTTGWGIAAARVAGSKTAALEIIERPWRGAPDFVYKIIL